MGLSLGRVISDVAVHGDGVTLLHCDPGAGDASNSGALYGRASASQMYHVLFAGSPNCGRRLVGSKSGWQLSKDLLRKRML